MASVLRNFSNLRFERGITPTDIDGFIEFADSVYVIIEMKYRNTELPGGQRRALENLSDRLCDSRRAILIVATHEVLPETGTQIDVGNCIVTEYRSRGVWYRPNHPVTVKAVIDQFRTRVTTW